ncbi:MAG: hypothetical protein AB8I08_31325 [Sandaracinaceae bacterium]
MMHPVTLDDVVSMDATQLDRAMRDGGPVDRTALRDRMYDGVSLNLPSVVEKLTWVKFTKVFKADGEGLRGWNCKVEQSGLNAPWVLSRSRGAPKTYGHYRVVSTADYTMPRPYGGGDCMLDYGLGKNPRLDPTSRVRDPVVALDEASELLLGWSYVDLGLTRTATPSYFVLRRGAPLDHDAKPPRG